MPHIRLSIIREDGTEVESVRAPQEYRLLVQARAAMALLAAARVQVPCVGGFFIASFAAPETPFTAAIDPSR